MENNIKFIDVINMSFCGVSIKDPNECDLLKNSLRDIINNNADKKGINYLCNILETFEAFEHNYKAGRYENNRTR